MRLVDESSSDSVKTNEHCYNTSIIMCQILILTCVHVLMRIVRIITNYLISVLNITHLWLTFKVVFELLRKY